MWVKQFLVLSAFYCHGALANYFTDIIGLSHVEEDIKNFGTLRVAVLLKESEVHGKCHQKDFPKGFIKAMNNGIADGLKEELKLGPPEDSALHVGPGLWNKMIHRALHKTLGEGGHNWRGKEGKTHEKNHERALRRLNGDDPFCTHMFGAAGDKYYIECACTGGGCRGDPQHRMLEGADEVVVFDPSTELRGLESDSEEDDPNDGGVNGAEAKAHHDELMGRFLKKYPKTFLELERGASIAALQIKHKIRDLNIECVDHTVAPVVVLAFSLVQDD